MCMYVYIYIYIYICIYIYIYTHSNYFKDTVYPLFESNTLFLECVFCVVFSCLAILESRDV